MWEKRRFLVYIPRNGGQLSLWKSANEWLLWLIFRDVCVTIMIRENLFKSKSLTLSFGKIDVFLSFMARNGGLTDLKICVNELKSLETFWTCMYRHCSQLQSIVMQIIDFEPPILTKIVGFQSISSPKLRSVEPGNGLKDRILLTSIL